MLKATIPTMIRDDQQTQQDIKKQMAKKTDTTDQANDTPPPPPTLGRIVHFTMNDQIAQIINAARKKAHADLRAKTSDRMAEPVRNGNEATEGQRVAMMIVAIHSETLVNGQLMLDGNDSHWVTSVAQGEGAGCWSWPERV